MATAIAATAACAKPQPKPVVAAVEVPRLKLAVLAVESDRFPAAAAAATASLATAKVIGVDDIEVSKVSLEVVQLSIECVEPTSECYGAVGRSLSANRLLFAQIAPSSKKRRAQDLRVTVTLFDVDTSAPAKTAEKVFRNERDASAGIDTLIAEATR